MTGRDLNYLHGQLASVGIVLEPAAGSCSSPPGPATPAAAATVDRAEVRSILVAAGAPAKDLDWLVASCPSIEDALGYERQAWCARCDGVTACDDQDQSCIACRGSR